MPNLYRRRGAEILVNTETSAAQLAQHIAVLPGGGFVMVWSDTSGVGGDTPDSGIKGQRFDADGNKVGVEFLANTAIDGFQGASEVAALDNGRFVVTWSSQIGPEGDDPGSGIKGQVFNADGTKSGGEFLVNTSAPDLQFQPSITALANGHFVVSWTDLSEVGDPDGGIKMQIFDSTGAPVGGELVANMITAGTQVSPAMAALASGGFAAVWSAGSKISFQLFDSAGARVGSELQVNTLPGGTTPDIAPLGSGFIVTWSHRDNALDPDGYEVFAQLLDANGAKIGGEFQVNTATAGDQTVARVAPLPDGSFLVTWQGPGAGSAGMDIHGQVFTAAGVKHGVEFVVNGIAAGAQTTPEIVVLASGDIVATWTDASGLGGDASPTGVKMQILTLATAGPTDIALSNATVSETAVANNAVATLTATGALNTSFTYTIVSDSSGGAFRIDGDRLVVDDNNLLDFETQPAVDVRIRATDLNGNSYEETMALTVADAAIEVRYSAGGEFMVPVATAGLQGEPIITPLEGGRFLIVWHSDSGSGLQGRIFEADGQASGGDFALTDFVFGADYPAIALPGGGFVLIWSGKTVGGDSSLVGQVFNAAGGTAGTKFAIDPTGIGEQIDVALIDSSHFVVSYGSMVQDDPNDPSLFGRQIRAQIFDLAGAEVGADFRVNTAVEGFQTSARIDSLPGGGFVAIWEDKGTEGIKAQLFDATGAKVGGEIAVLAGVAALGSVDVAALASGGFVATWGQLVDEGEPTEHVELFGQLVGADGIAIGSAFLVDAILSNYNAEARVEALPDGGFVIAWNGISLFGDGDGDAVVAQIYNAAGVRVGDPFVVNAVTREDQVSHSLAITQAGELLFTWSDVFHPPGNVDANIKSRIFTVVSAPSSGPTEGPDTLYGTPGADVIYGLGGNDTIKGLGGDDFIDGGAGADTMSGGAGNDTYVVDAGDTVIEAAGQGFDQVYSSTSFTLGGGVEVEVLAAGDSASTAALNFVGNEFGQTIFGNAGANVLTGGGGADALYGRAGDDIYSADNLDVVVENAGEGFDQVYALASFALNAGAEVEVIAAGDSASTAALNLYGNEYGQSIIGNAGANTLVGGGGADGLYGLGGDDIYSADVQDVVVENAGEGFDQVYSVNSFTLNAGAEVEVIAAGDSASTAALNLYGNEYGQQIIGNAGVNILVGGGGADGLYGLGGDDIYSADGQDVVVENAGQGFDQVYSLSSFTLNAGAEVEVIAAGDSASTAALNLYGNEFGQQIIGNAGANTLVGGAGADGLYGLAGDDIYSADGQDVVVENAGEGFDQVYALASFALNAGAEIELIAAGDSASTAVLNLTGNEFGQQIIGNAGANILDGGGGADSLTGGAGADTFAFTTALGGGNVDAIADFSAADDTIGLENAVFTGLGLGVLSANAFVVGAAAADADDRIVYDQATGRLFFDADGNGAGAAVHFATLQGSPVITASDFTVI